MHAIGLLGRRWKLVMLFHLFGGNVLRFSDLERAIPAISQKMLGQQLHQMARTAAARATSDEGAARRCAAMNDR